MSLLCLIKRLKPWDLPPWVTWKGWELAKLRTLTWHLVPRLWNWVGQQALCWHFWDKLISGIETKGAPAKILSPGLRWAYLLFSLLARVNYSNISREVTNIFPGNIFFNLLINFWLRWVVIAACRLSLLAVKWGCSWVAVLRILIALASLVGRAQALGHTGFSSCGTQAPCMWDLPKLGVKLMFSALAGRFLTTRSQGSPPGTIWRVIFKTFQSVDSEPGHLGFS